MPFQIGLQRHTLQFSFEARTSRGAMHQRDTWLVFVRTADEPERVGIGEAAPLPGLSPDAGPDFAANLQRFSQMAAGLDRWPQLYTIPSIENHPAILSGLEMAFLDWEYGGKRQYFAASAFLAGHPLPINGLIWMGDAETMRQRLEEKLEAGFTTIKLKIGGIRWEDELGLLKAARELFGPDEITLRVDANGAFSPEEAPAKLEALAKFGVHSIEQPIRAGLPEEMARLCETSPLPIALDEELIGHHTPDARRELLEAIRPPYIILKPSLLGGIGAAMNWVKQAEARDIGWWATSALESNVGLNAIAQFTAETTQEHAAVLPQGLGTGQLYTNNFTSPLRVAAGQIRYQPEGNWGSQWDSQLVQLAKAAFAAGQ